MAFGRSIAVAIGVELLLDNTPNAIERTVVGCYFLAIETLPMQLGGSIGDRLPMLRR
jgi:hypothetical protein